MVVEVVVEMVVEVVVEMVVVVVMRSGVDLLHQRLLTVLACLGCLDDVAGLLHKSSTSKITHPPVELQGMNGFARQTALDGILLRHEDLKISIQLVHRRLRVQHSLGLLLVELAQEEESIKALLNRGCNTPLTKTRLLAR